MTTSNGQHLQQPLDPERSSRQATSTVLALDGWGPVIAEPTPNGANGSEPEAVATPPPAAAEIHTPRTDWRDAVRSGWQREASRPTIDPQLIRILTSAAAMTIAVFLGLQLGGAYQRLNVEAPVPPPVSGSAALRRRIALAIDPSLQQPQPEPMGLRRWLSRDAFRLN